MPMLGGAIVRNERFKSPGSLFNTFRVCAVELEIRPAFGASDGSDAPRTCVDTVDCESSRVELEPSDKNKKIESKPSSLAFCIGLSIGIPYKNSHSTVSVITIIIIILYHHV
jgi:hypothetical protein